MMGASRRRFNNQSENKELQVRGNREMDGKWDRIVHFPISHHFNSISHSFPYWLLLTILCFNIDY